MSLLAILLVLGAALAHAAWNVIAHAGSGSGIPFIWCGAFASTVLWLPIVPFTGGIGPSLSGFLAGIAVSSVLHVAYMIVLQRGYAVGSLSTVYATARGTGPTITVIVAVLFLGERPSALALAGVVAIIAGVVAAGLVDRQRPTASVVRRGIDPAIAFGLLTGVTIALYTVWDAFVVRSWQVNPVAFMVGCTAMECLLLAVPLRRRAAETLQLARRQWRTLVAFGVLSPLSYILVLEAVQIAPVALVAPMREVSVVLVSLFGAFVLREGRPALRVAASVVVVAGIALLAM